MKMNDKYVHLSVMHTLLSLYDMKDLAKSVTKAICKDHGDIVELQTMKNSGFILRRKKDGTITDKEISKIMADVIKELMDDKIDEVLDYISENYEFAYDSSAIGEEFIKEIFDISRTGRLIYIEIDI